MKLEIKFKSKTGMSRRFGWKKARCDCCNQVLTFPSWIKAREYAKKFATDTQIERVD